MYMTDVQQYHTVTEKAPEHPHSFGATTVTVFETATITSNAVCTTGGESPKSYGDVSHAHVPNGYGHGLTEGPKGYGEAPKQTSGSGSPKGYGTDDGW